MKIGTKDFDEFVKEVQAFHGNIAPGVVAGGIMVDLAIKHLPPGILFDAVCETGHCLPDAVQLLTPCTMGNGWLKVVETGRFAVALYDKYTGEGMRVFLDAAKLRDFPEIRAWFLREKRKEDQDMGMLLDELRRAGGGIFTISPVRMSPAFLEGKKRKKSPIRICAACGEAYSASLGNPCPACRGEGPYVVEH